MKTPLPLIVSLCSFAASTFAQEFSDPGTRESGFYQFFGTEILAHYRKKIEPIVSADQKGIYVDIGKKKPKRLSWNTFCASKPIVGVSNRLIHINDLNHSVFYQKESRTDGKAYDAIRQRKDHTDTEIAQLKSVESITPAAREAIEMLELERDVFTSNMEDLIRNDDLKKEGHADSIRVELKLTPDSDYGNAFCAVVADYSNTRGERRVVIKLSRLGELLKDIPETRSFSVFLGEGDFRQSRFEFYLFSGDGTPIPTNRSRGLRMLSVAEFEELTKQRN